MVLKGKLDHVTNVGWRLTVLTVYACISHTLTMFSTAAGTLLLGVKLHAKKSGNFQQVHPSHHQVEKLNCQFPYIKPPSKYLPLHLTVKLETLGDTSV